MTVENNTQQSWSFAEADPDDARDIADMQARSMMGAYFSSTDTERNKRLVAYVNEFITTERITLRKEFIKSAAASDNELYLAAKTTQQQIVGMLYGHKNEERQEIWALYTDQDYRRRGLGRALIERFIDWSDPQRPIQLGVLVDNLNAQAFYSELGFAKTDDPEHDFKPIEGMKEITMVRKGDEQ